MSIADIIETMEMVQDIEVGLAKMEAELRVSLKKIDPNMDWESKNLATLITYACATIDIFNEDLRMRQAMVAANNEEV